MKDLRPFVIQFGINIGTDNYYFKTVDDVVTDIQEASVFNESAWAKLLSDTNFRCNASYKKVYLDSMILTEGE